VEVSLTTLHLKRASQTISELCARGIRPASQEQAHELVANDPVYSPTILHNILTFGQWQFLSNTDLCISAHRSESPEYPKR
jgi:hypothetical protein